jgi:predicted deacetylase
VRLAIDDIEPRVCVVIHDVADATLPACERLIDAIEDVAPVPLTFLAVPRYHGRRASEVLEDWLQQRHRRADEIALHGWTHLDDGAPAGLIDRARRTRYTRGEGEFWALDEGEAARRLAAGIAWFEDCGWPLRGFVPPAWLLGPGGWDALRATPFRYTSTLRRIHLLGEAGASSAVTSQSIVYSIGSAWRRQCSQAWAGIVAAAERRNPLLRIELHPRDADSPAIRRSWQRILERALATRRPTTVDRWVEDWRAAQGGPAPALPAAGPTAG